MFLDPVKREESDLDFKALDLALDQAKSQIFMGSNSGFYAPLMCSMNFVWTEGIKRAATDYVSIFFNPHWFLEIPRKTRGSVILHELKHCAHLHGIRMGERDPKGWNYACDYFINADIMHDGHDFQGASVLYKKEYAGMLEEAIYDDLMAKGFGALSSFGNGQDNDDGDMLPMSNEQKQAAMNNVVQAMNQAKVTDPGSIPAGVESLIKGFMTPKVSWKTALSRFMKELNSKDWSYRRPNRRYSSHYVPSLLDQRDKLANLIWYFDVSGSVTDDEVRAFVGEVYYVHRTFKPKKMTIVLFDTIIQKEIVIEQNDSLTELHIVGRGGTCLRCVRQHMIDNKPTAAIVFSDLWCEPMERLPQDIPLIWVCIDNPQGEVNFGQLIHIKAL